MIMSDFSGFVEEIQENRWQGFFCDQSNFDIHEEPMAEVKTAIITAPSGSTMNMLVRANASAALVKRVPIGSVVSSSAESNSHECIMFFLHTVHLYAAVLPVTVFRGFWGDKKKS
jgi:hypothetical protein